MTDVPGKRPDPAAAGCGCAGDADRLERRTLLTLLAINGTMFVAEAVGGYLADSAALLADSLDMLADALVYGLALAAVGRSARGAAAAATVSGVMQLALGAGVLVEAGRRFLYGSDPVGTAAAAVGAVALAANVTCLLLLANTAAAASTCGRRGSSRRTTWSPKSR